ncbi:hypothetical protein ACINLE_17475 [Bacillus sp. z60-18]|uniref:hypothetical protein n=1 Tax=unclassified Bacillus (in: firmicutes) TaxID=185979 RepID=UPI00390C9C0D
MNLIEFKKLLEATGYPVAYSHFKAAVEPPFITYTTSDTSNLMADNQVYKKITDVQVDLYTSIKDPVVEAKLEQLLDQNKIPYEADETWIESEQLFQRIYYLGVI